jgi:pimeloyl-ACP methyl ester carboxylesterase
VIVQSAGVAIATTEWRGPTAKDGPPVLLTHGFGGEQTHLDPIAKRLSSSCRVVTFDLRNHGESGEGEWTWPLVLADVAAVRDAYELDRPVVGGHSLGGMVGVLFAEEHPDTRGVVNFDGHGQGKPEQYDGLSPDEVAAGLARLHDVQVALSGEPPPAFQAMLRVIEQLFMFDHYDKLDCPLLVFNAVGDDPLTNIEGNEWIGDFMGAYRRGLGRDLAALASAHPNVEIETIQAAHYLIFSHADEVAARVARFVESLNRTH